VDFSLQPAGADLQRAREIVRINFGAQQLNDLLGGGLESKAITEIFGEYRCRLPPLIAHGTLARVL